MTFKNTVIPLIILIVLWVTLIVVSANKGWLDVDSVATEPAVDYLWVHRNTQTQEAAKDFKKVCEAERLNVDSRGLSDREKDRNDLVQGFIVDIDLEYDFKYTEHKDTVDVSASCYVEGYYQENVFRVLPFETTKITGKYTLTK